MFGNIRIYKVKNILRMIPDHRDTFQIIQTLFPSYGHLSNHPDTFQIIRIPFRSSVHISYHLDTTHFRSPGSSRHFSYHQNTFRITQRLVRSSGYFADHSNTFRSSRHFAYQFKIILTISLFHPAGQPAEPFRICKNSQASIYEVLVFLTLNPLKIYVADLIMSTSD